MSIPVLKDQVIFFMMYVYAHCSRFVYFLTFFLFCRHVGYIYPWQAGTTRGGARARTEDDDTYTGIDRRQHLHRY